MNHVMGSRLRDEDRSPMYCAIVWIAAASYSLAHGLSSWVTGIALGGGRSLLDWKRTMITWAEIKAMDARSREKAKQLEELKDRLYFEHLVREIRQEPAERLRYAQQAG